MDEIITHQNISVIINLTIHVRRIFPTKTTGIGQMNALDHSAVDCTLALALPPHAVAWTPAQPKKFTEAVSTL